MARYWLRQIIVSQRRTINTKCVICQADPSRTAASQAKESRRLKEVAQRLRQAAGASPASCRTLPPSPASPCGVTAGTGSRPGGAVARRAASRSSAVRSAGPPSLPPPTPTGRCRRRAPQRACWLPSYHCDCSQHTDCRRGTRYRRPGGRPAVLRCPPPSSALPTAA